MMKTPAVRSRPLFSTRQSYPLTPTQSPHRTDSPIQSSTEHTSRETIFMHKICDMDGRRWSLRAPASGLSDDMVNVLEELEKLAVD